MKSALGTLAVFATLCLSSHPAFSQDIKVREQAVRLLERANALSTSPRLPNLERVDTFRAYDDSGVVDGRFRRVVIQGVGRRDEYSFGAYHMLNVWTQRQVAAAGTPKLAPPELMNVLRMTPMWLVSFDHNDVIHAVSDRSVGDSTAHCIEFDTVQGQQTDNNEICIDAKTGTILSERLAGEIVEYGNFFLFAGALIPGKINYSHASGTEKIEITQTMTVLDNPDPALLTAPADAQVHKYCTTFRRPFGTFMPQPKPGNSGQDTDVVVGVNVGVDGRVFDATVQRSDREDLDAEALGLARQWTFTPAMCDGHPDREEVSVVLHFQGR